MSITSTLNGQTKISVQMSGTGDAPRKLEETARGVRGVEKASEGVTSTLGKARRGFMDMAEAADNGVLKVREGFMKIVETGTLIVAAVTGIYSGLKALGDLRFAETDRQLRVLAGSAGAIAQGFAEAANQASNMRREIAGARRDEISLRIASATASGNPKLAKELTSLLTLEQGRADAAGARQRAADAERAAGRMAGQQAATLVTRAANDARIAQIEDFFRRGGGQAMALGRGEVDGPGANADALRRELEGRKAMAAVMSMGVIPPTWVATQREGAKAFESLATAIEENTRAQLDKTDRDYEASLAPKGGGRGGPSRSTGGGRGVMRSGGVRRGSQLVGPANDDDFTPLLSTNDGTPVLDAIGAAREQATVWLDIASAVTTAGDAIARVIPEFSELGVVMSQVTALWQDYGQANFDVSKAIVGSVGAIAMAGAAQIKGEREKAGVMSVIQLGMGLGKQFIPGMQAEAAGHFAAAATLAGVAIFGTGGSGSSSSRATSERTVVRPLSERTQSGLVQNNFYGPYIATGSSAQSAAELHAMQRAGESGGWVPRAA